MIIRSKLTFFDIMESNVLYYSEEQEEACKMICEELRIDYLPSLSGNERHYLNPQSSQFEKSIIPNNQKIQASDSILDKDLLKKFRSINHNVLFVFQGDLLVGVVHICDYNKDIVIEIVQNWVLELEQSLRKLLHSIGVEEDELVKNRSKSGGNTDKFGPFQTFYLKALLDFVDQDQRFELEIENLTDINNLRNSVMHGKNSVEMKDSIYDLNSLKVFFDRLDILEKTLDKTRFLIFNNNLDLVRELNDKKLSLIKDHGLKGIQVLLDF